MASTRIQAVSSCLVEVPVVQWQLHGRWWLLLATVAAAAGLALAAARTSPAVATVLGGWFG